MQRLRRRSDWRGAAGAEGVQGACRGRAGGVQGACGGRAEGVRRVWMQRAQRAQRGRKVAAHRGGRVGRRRACGRRIARHSPRDRHHMGGHGHACDRLALYRLAEGGGVPVGGGGNVSVVGPSGLTRVGARVRVRVRTRAKGGEG